MATGDFVWVLASPKAKVAWPAYVEDDAKVKHKLPNHVYVYYFEWDKCYYVTPSLIVRLDSPHVPKFLSHRSARFVKAMREMIGYCQETENFDVLNILDVARSDATLHPDISALFRDMQMPLYSHCRKVAAGALRDTIDAVTLGDDDFTRQAACNASPPRRALRKRQAAQHSIDSSPVGCHTDPATVGTSVTCPTSTKFRFVKTVTTPLDIDTSDDERNDPTFRLSPVQKRYRSAKSRSANAAASGGGGAANAAASDGGGAAASSGEDAAADSGADTGEPVAAKRRKRRPKVANPLEWFRTKRKNARLSGTEFKVVDESTGEEKVVVKQREVLPWVCAHKNKCSEKFTVDERKAIFDSYYSAGNIQAQRDFLLMRSTKKDVGRRRPRKNKEEPTQRSTGWNCTFVKNDEVIDVCKGFFGATIGFSSDSALRTARMRATEQGQFQAPPPPTPVNKTPDADKALVNKHINSIPAVESHYTRKRTEKKYLEPGLTVTKMYELYCEWLRDEHPDSKPVTESLYRRTLNNEHNIGFFKPKKDLCTICENDNMAQMTPEEAETYLTQVKQPHIDRNHDAQDEKALDKQRAATDPTYVSVTFDLQAVLYTPCSDASPMYYKSKLCVYNLTVFEQAPPQPTQQHNADSPRKTVPKNDAYCYLWPETVAKRGGNEIGSCLHKYLSNLRPSVRHVSFYSDTCAGQNRNRHVAALLLLHVQTDDNIDIIDQKFLEPGHTHMEVDSMHAAIERAKKFQKIYTPDSWFHIITAARRGKPYNVDMMELGEIYNMESLATSLIGNCSVNTDGERFYWSKTVWFRFRKDSPSSIFYKAKFTDAGFKELKLNPRATRSHATSSATLTAVNSCPLPISAKKYKDLMDLIKSGAIPQRHAAFYRDLAHSTE